MQQPFKSLIVLIIVHILVIFAFDKSELLKYKEKVKRMFYHAYNGYLDYAYPYDELMPLTCSGMDTWGSFSLTLVDALDTLIVMGNFTEFERASRLVLENVNVDANVNVSVFETNIRVVGGLLSAHMLSGLTGIELEDGWPCHGPLLRLAERMAYKLLPAFNSKTGMPYGTVNLKYGLHKLETPVTCTAGVGTFLIEFASLSRLTGNHVFERVSNKAMEQLYKHRSSIGLLGNHINVETGIWTATDAGIGAGVDSYYEYLVKAAVLFDRPELMRQFKEQRKSIEKYMEKGDWFPWVSMAQGQVTMPVFQSLEAFWPGVLTLVGDVDKAYRIMMNYYQIVRQYGFIPEFYNIYNSEAMQKRSGYPLRPEFIESLMYLYRATKDPLLLEIGAELVDVIEEQSKTKCGYATVQDVRDHVLEDRMESFFLAETTKYLYLLFDEENFIHNPGLRGHIIDTPNGACVINSGGYIFNTEAHPVDPSILYCCDKRRQRDQLILNDFNDNIDLIGILGLYGDDRDTEFQLIEEDFEEELAIFEEDLEIVDTSNDFKSGEVLNNSKNKAGNNDAGRSDDQESSSQSSIAVSARKSPRKIGSKPMNKRQQSLDVASYNVEPSNSEAWKELSLFDVQLDNIDSSLQSLKNVDGMESSIDYCTRRDYFSDDRNLDVLLNAVYRRSEIFRIEDLTDKCHADAGPDEQDNYRREWPAQDTRVIDENDQFAVSNMNTKTFRNLSRQSEYHYEIMLCKARNFLASKSTVLGSVAPSDYLSSSLVHN